ncbi:MAG: A/G-specific adenine glycosylase [Candidatus Babeliales bacterium]
MNPTQHDIASFQSFIWDFYAREGRTFPWRNVDDPYRVVVSEIMLQQTQTYRVEPKYERFILAFPSFELLAQATLRDVLTLWQGLGYNRRGMYLHQCTQKVMAEYNGQLPADPVVLETFPGIGKNTAGSVCAFAFNKPVVFIETNIRSVFIHSFFKDQTDVTDKQLYPLIEQTIDHTNPREWYYALMDYGVFLKKKLSNPSRRSAHHATQSRFEGSDRQIRGMVLRYLTNVPQAPLDTVIASTKKDPERVKRIIDQLCAEKLIAVSGDIVLIA